MKEVCYEFEELESDASFEQLGKAFQGSFQQDTLHFDSPFVKGQLIRKVPEDGLWIRKWKLTVLQKVTLHRHAASEGAERKFSLIYFLNPAIFNLKEGAKKVNLNTQRNNMFLSNEVMMDFSVMPKQPFYVLDITFTRNWLLKQFQEDDLCLRKIVDLQMKDPKLVLMEPCQTEEYKLLHELDTFLQADKEDVLFVRSRIYQLICSFFTKAFEKADVGKQKQATYNYEQMVQAEAILMQQLQKPPKVAEIAKKINMSTSSLLRQFKALYGKSLHEYYTGKKMEMARRMVMEKQITIKKLAETLGYKQASHFIETFTRHYGYSPGCLKAY
jgi:AraC-like DNA-binding protein